jgi:cell division protease FtsH
MQDLEDAKDKVMMGTERRSMVMSDDEKKLTAYHEAGHAISALHSPASDPIHKATIIPRGRALGMVVRLPERDQYSLARDKMEANLVVLMGGRIAEEMMFGRSKVTSGASGDIAQATKLARSMVTVWGMSDKLGPLLYNDDQEEVFLGHSVTQTKNVSAATAELIDTEVRRIIDDAYEGCKVILTENRNELELLGEALLEYETLSGDEIKAVINGETIVRGDDDGSASPVKSSVPSAGNIGIVPDPKPQPGT